MWTVTVDSNVPIQTSTFTADSPARISKTGRSVSAGRYGSSESYIKSTKRSGDVDDLLGSQSPKRSHSPVGKGLPPPSSRSSLRSRSHSPSVLNKRPQSPTSVSSRNQTYWQDEWTKALENAVDDLVCEEGINWDNFLPKDDEQARRLNTSLDGALHLDSGVSSRERAGGGPVKASYDKSMSIQDSDSGVGSLKHRSSGLTSDDIRSGIATRLSRSRSMSRLNSSLNSETMSLPGLSSSLRGPDLISKSVRELQVALDDSESRRNVLMHKLKEAQTTLELQNERLGKIENAARENNTLVEDLKFKEKEYRKKISQLESSEEEKQRLQLENIRLREEMQDRISALDYQLKGLKNQHRSNENENDKRITLLDHTTAALSLLEEENAKLQQDKEKLLTEISLMKEAFHLTKSRYGALDDDNRNLKNDSIRLREDNQALTRKVQEMAGQMIELRSLLQAVKDENERLSSTWKDTAEDKSRAARQVESYQDTITDLKARLAATSADRDRLFSEKLEMSSKIQQMVLDKEQMMKANLNLEDQINEQHSHRSYHRPTPGGSTDKQIRELTHELASVKKVSEELSTELASVKGFYEAASEQCAKLERNKSLWQSQQDLSDQERKRMQGEIDRLNQILTSRGEDDRREHQYQEEIIHKMRTELKQLKLEKHDLENKVQELEVKLGKANEGLREGSALQHSEIDTWKNTCERLTNSVSRKESELQNLTDRCHELEDTISGLRQELRVVKDKNNLLSDKDEEAERLKDENRRLLQEKAENEQMMKLLETQKEVLSKSSEDTLNKLNELEQLSIQMDGLRDENECLRRRAQELERVKDSLEQQKEELLLEQPYKSPSFEDLEKKMEELRDANKQLREVNEAMSHKLDVVNQENSKMKQAMGKSLTKTESEKLQEENMRLQSEYNNLKHEYGALDAKHQRFVINYGHDGEVAAKEKHELVKLRKEKDATEKQVTLLQGQMSLLEGSKKRAEEQISKLTAELNDARAQLKQASSLASSNKGAESGNAAMQKELESLRQQLEKAKENQKVQEKMMKNLREESLQDVEVELQQMRSKLQQLMEEIQRKELTIDDLEAELRAYKQTANSKSSELEVMEGNMKKVQEENKDLRQNLEEIRSTLAAELAQEEEDTRLRRSQSEKTLQEELMEAVKNKKNGTSGRSKTPTPYLSRSLNQLDLRPASAPPLDADKVPDKAATEGSDRLQSLISKYRSHSDTQQATGQASPLRVVKPLPGFVASKIVRPSGSPKAPMRRTSDPNSPDPPISPLAKQDGDSPVPIMSSRTPRKVPPPPAPKPPSPPATSARSSFLRTLSSDNESGDKSNVSTSPIGKPSAIRAAAASSAISGGETGGLSSLSSLRAKAGSTPASGPSRSLASSGLGTTTSTGSNDGLGDSGEQKDINALIQKMSLFDEMAAF